MTEFVCCFCGQPTGDAARTLEITLSRFDAPEGDPAQGFYCHPDCLSTRLAPQVPFDPDVFFD